MREVISIDRDFVNNTETLSAKIKPKSQYKGKVTVSLYDEKGNKEREIKTENIVFDWVKAYSFNSMYKNNFSLGSMGALNDATSCTGTIKGMLPLSKYLMLFNGEHEDTNPRKSLIKDDMVGYAGRYEQYSGSDTLKGTYNKLESYFYKDKEDNLVFRMVYDFPTHAANGSITGVGLGHTITKNAELIPTRATMLNSSNNYGLNVYTSSAFVNKSNDLFCGLFTNGYNNAIQRALIGRDSNYSQYKTITGLNTFTFKPNTLSSGKNYIAYTGYDALNRNSFISYNTTSSITVAESYSGVYEITTDGNIKVFARKILPNDEVVTYEKTLGFDFSSILGLRSSCSTNGYSSAFIYINTLFSKNDKFIVHVTTDKNTYMCSNTTNKSYIFKFDGNGNYEKHIDLGANNNYNIKLMPYGDCYLISYGKGKFTKVDSNFDSAVEVNLEDLNINNKDKIDLDFIMNNVAYNGYVGSITEEAVYFIDIANTSSQTYIRLKDDRINLSSYTRLPSPITKTSTNTMKVKYDIVIEDVSIYDYIEY